MKRRMYVIHKESQKSATKTDHVTSVLYIEVAKNNSFYFICRSRSMKVYSF
jgi:hypothetical protein